MLGKKLINSGPTSSGANTFASENFNTVLYTGNGGTQRIGGYINRGAVFNGSAYITTGYKAASSTAASISLWVSIAAYTSYGGFAIDSTGTGAQARFTLGQGNTGGKLWVSVANGSSSWYDETTVSISSYGLNNWFHLAGTVDGTSVKIYINGSLIHTFTSSVSYVGGGQHNYYLGGWGNSLRLNGKMDQVRFFNKAISSSEVTTLYGETFASTTISTTDIFDDNSGQALYQLDGNANDTGINVAAHTGKSLVLSGNNASGQPYAYSSNITNSSSYTIAAWVKFDSVSSNAFIFSKFENNVNENFLFQTSSGSLYGVIYTSGSTGIGAFSNSALDINRWYHIAFVVGGGAAKLYMDGAYVSQITYGGTPRTSNRYIQFGWRSGGSTGINSPMDGLMEDVQFYNSALSAGDITTIYTNNTASGLVARWKFDDNLNDETGNYNATSTNTVAYSTDVPGARTIRKNGTASNVLYQEATKFTPDLVWIKRRSSTEDHAWFDSVRGVQRQISSNLTSAGYTTTNAVSSFDSTGFTTGGNGATNSSGHTYVAWCFNAGSGNAASNTNGTITSTVKANTAAGFSIVSYTANGTAGTTIGHGLSQAPQLIIVKHRNGTSNWPVYATGLSAVSKYLYLNTSGAETSSSNPDEFHSTAPTSSVFSIGVSGNTNTNNGNYIAYCFHSVDSYQKIGTYNGDGSTSGHYIETGFEPAFLMIKGTSHGGSWAMLDNERSTTNPRDEVIYADSNGAEGANDTYVKVNFLTNGFELKTNDSGINMSGRSYLYLAIAADPDQTDPTVENSFSSILWSGTGSARSVTGLGFKPDLIWWKARNSSNYNWKAVDSINGPTKNLYNNLTNSLANDVATTSFDDDGFTFGSGGNGNASGLNYAGYAWKAGDHDDSIPQINTEGTIQSIVSVNDAAGFSIVKYTGNSTAGATVGHGLSTAPQLIIVKLLGGISAKAWTVYSETIGNTKYLYLNTSASAATYNFWNNTSPTSSVFSLSSDTNVNSSSGTYIAYCWSSVTGYSKIGSYTGTGATGNVQTLGFRPRFIMIKSTSNAEPWFILDSKRNPTNPVNNRLMADSSASESANSVHTVDFTDTGFTANGTLGDGTNGNGVSYIYMAFK